MNRSAHARQVVLLIVLVALLSPSGLVRAQFPTPSPTPPPNPAPTPQPPGGQKVKLYYMREATKINAVLTAISKQPGSMLDGLLVANASEDELILYGPDDKRTKARRIIATLDLPRPGIVMEMWGIQISSRKPDDMARVMALIRNEINRTQQDVREAYYVLEKATRTAIKNDDALNREFNNVLVKGLFYRSALSLDHPLSLADILLRMTAAQDPGGTAVNIATTMQEWFRGKQKQWNNNKDLEPSEVKLAFPRFFSIRGLEREGNNWTYKPDEMNDRAQHSRDAILEFALHYGRLVHEPESFSPFRLQTASEILNTRLQAATDSINLDMQEMFVAPTLQRIQKIVRKFKDVEYAQVGKTSVASLSGVQADVTSKSVNAFDVTPPLRLSELLKKADELSKSVGPFVPNPADNVVGAMPISQVIGLIGAFGEERSVWRELNSGITLSITPNVLRNMTSAELKIVLQTGDPQTAPVSDKGVRPLSRVSQHNVTTSIYVDPLDFFDLSAFASQATHDGGRGYVPILGPVWRGIFGEIPFAGELFSWKRSPQTVFSESLVLTTSFITPTSMGIALLYPTEIINPQTGEWRRYDNEISKCQWESFWRYKNDRKIFKNEGCFPVDKTAASAK
jgi:hypothetical protein